MICENCKERPASVTITQESVVGSVERHLCEKCTFQSQTFHFDPNQEPLSIQQFLSHWFSGSDPFLAQQLSRGEPLTGPECPSCGLTFPKFLDIGKFGCAECYDTFRGNLQHVFGKLHNGHATHTGKVPVSFNELYAVKKKIEEIRVRMKDAVDAERFEEAAALRDEANTLKQQLTSGGDDNDVD
jgi:protein arginine kinase activator